MFDEAVMEHPVISFQETHHEINGKPLYEKRFSKVLSYHNGIAPVYTEIDKKKVAYFIDYSGDNIFDRYFIQAFGFYDGLAAVCDESGFFHINLDGKDLYKNRYAWCGNFVENKCSVCDFEGNYFHISINGERLYNENFIYVGDFKYGIAVAVLKNGKSVHIFENGIRVHNMEYDALYPYHKGYAVAKDSKGFFHIDKAGKELYKERYAELEPFYNNKALATDFYGNKLIIDYDSLGMAQSSEHFLFDDELVKQKIYNTFARDAFSFFDMRILYAVLELGILQNIKINKSCEIIDINLDKTIKDLLISWLEHYGYIKNNMLTIKGEAVLDIKDVICYWQSLPYNTSCYLIESIKNNCEFFSNIYGAKFFNFIKNNQKYSNYFSFISSFYSSDYSNLNIQLSNEIVCDLGCGSGALLDALKVKFPKITPVYADLIDNRINKNSEFYNIDFFKPLPSNLNADVYIMSRIMHDYNDKDALIIFKHIADKMKKDNKLYLFETVLDNSSKGITVSFHILNMLGGRERTISEIESLLNKAGLSIINKDLCSGTISLLEVKKND